MKPAGLLWVYCGGQSEVSESRRADVFATTASSKGDWLESRTRVTALAPGASRSDLLHCEGFLRNKIAERHTLA